MALDRRHHRLTPPRLPDFVCRRVADTPPQAASNGIPTDEVGTDEIARPAGLLSAGSDGRGELLLEGDANAAAAVGMTLEPAGGSRQPTTEPIVVLSLT